MSRKKTHPCPPAFTLIELLTVIAIISLLISILLPSLSRAREQAKSVHCLAKLHEFGTALGAYINTSGGRLPPAQWKPDKKELEREADVFYGWTEILWAYVYQENVRLAEAYPVQRHLDPERFTDYMLCRAVGSDAVNSGHYRVYLPAWSVDTYSILPDGKYGEETHASPWRGAMIERIRPRLPIIGDANEESERGDGIGNDECSYIDAGEANIAGTRGYNGNRFSDRHYGGANYLFADHHAERTARMRDDLARDWDLNGIDDIEIVP